MRQGRLGWCELLIFLVTSAIVTIIVFIQTKNMAWRVLSFPLAILLALCIAYWAPNSVIKIKKKKHDKEMQNLARARASLHP